MIKSFELNENFELSLKESSTVTLIINSSKLDINYDLKDGEYNILVFNNSNNDLLLSETGTIDNANVNITYLELSNLNYYQVTKINVNENSTLNVNSIYLGVHIKDITFDMYNRKRNSNVYINNNVVCLNDADFSLNVIGNIDKGSKNSKCLQKSQCLTFESPKKAKVLPVLNIDENDVEAAHSLSSGTIDEEVLFYMNARGLNKKEALGLLLTSYLMPNEDFYKSFEKGLIIKDIADKKVEKICTI